MKYLPLLLALFLMGAAPQRQVILNQGSLTIAPAEGDVSLLDPYEYSRYKFRKSYYKRPIGIASQTINGEDFWIVEFDLGDNQTRAAQ